MRITILITLLFITKLLAAQHCPWDCSGIVILDWPANKSFPSYTVSLVDKNHEVVSNHNVYESPESKFQLYGDLKKELSSKIPQNHWYENDTVFHFAEGSPVTLYNYCDYRGDLFVEVRFNTTSQKWYFKLNEDQKFHLHNMDLWQGKTPQSFNSKYRVKIRF
jgi:hypothetical protein